MDRSTVPRPGPRTRAAVGMYLSGLGYVDGTDGKRVHGSFIYLKKKN